MNYHLPPLYRLEKDPVTDDGETLTGWAVVSQQDNVVLGHGFKTTRQAIIFAAGCEAGKHHLARMF